MGPGHAGAGCADARLGSTAGVGDPRAACCTRRANGGLAQRVISTGRFSWVPLLGLVPLSPAVRPAVAGQCSLPSRRACGAEGAILAISSLGFACIRENLRLKNFALGVGWPVANC